MKLSHARGATQDGQVMVERADRMWSTGEGNGKLLQYSCLENPMNSMRRASRNSTKSLFLPQFSHFPWINWPSYCSKALNSRIWKKKKCWSWSFSLTTSLLLWRNTFLRSLPYHSKCFLCHWDFYIFCYFLLLWTSVYVKTWPQPNFLTMSVYFL